MVVEAEYRTQTVLHNAMETHQSVARWEGDTLEIYISTQFIWGIRDSVSEQLGLPPDRVRVVCNYMGGGFGAKNGPGDYTYIAIALAGKTGRPVRCALTPARGEPRHRATATARSSSCAPARAPTGRSSRSRPST